MLHVASVEVFLQLFLLCLDHLVKQFEKGIDVVLADVTPFVLLHMEDSLLDDGHEVRESDADEFHRGLRFRACQH